MLTINKLRSHSAIDYAAEELKKYLRMMMPEGGEIAIFFNPQAKDGFRLGLLEDFGLPFEGACLVEYSRYRSEYRQTYSRPFAAG